MRVALLATALAAGAAASTGPAAGARPRALPPRPRALPPHPRATSAPARLIVDYRGRRPRIRVVPLPRHSSLSTALRAERARRGVAWVQPDWVARASGFYPDDPGRAHRPQGWASTQWNLLPGAGVDAPQAWANLLADHRAGGRGVRIAVLDSGVAYRDWHGFRKSPDFGETRFVAPYDFVAHDRYPLDRSGHGTFVAAAIGESTNNRIGLTGLAYGASIMPVRVLDAENAGDETVVAAGIRYAVAHGANVINLSLEFLPNQVRSPSDIPEVVSAIADARRHGVVVVAGAGNDETGTLAYPARLPGVLAVGATTRDRCLANYSDTGPGLALVAPGGGSDTVMPSDPDCHPERALPPIYQLTLSNPPRWGAFGYPDFYIGTSMAAPEAAATAGLVIASGVLGSHPSPEQIIARLEETATPLPAGVRPPNDAYGYGLLDAGTATEPSSPAADVGAPVRPGG